ncbi:MAG: hypothetical protein EOO88_39085 [Pedobacter sp.]|nr:MAG: hypothetical protein EOO88_39085 [Pedobacter sp.]
MKYSRPILIIAFALSTTPLLAQLSYIGLDKIRTFDGYKKGWFSGGIIFFKGKYYFSTPNGNLFQTDGSMRGTVLLKTSQRDIVTLKATNDWIYYTPDSGYNPQLQQFDPVSGADRGFKYTDLVMPSDRLCESCEVPQSEVFVSADRSKVFIRNFGRGMQFINMIDDKAPENQVTEVFKTSIPQAGITFQLIRGNTRVAEIRDEVYFNGTINFADAKNVETSVTAFERVNGATPSYKLLTDYRLKAKGIKLYPNFLRTAGALYVIASKGDNEMFFMRVENAGLRQLASFPDKALGYTCFLLSGQIYATWKDKIYRYDEGTDNMVLLHQFSNSSLETVSGGVNLLKVGAYLMFRQDGVLRVLNEKTGKVDLLSATVAFPSPAKMDRLPIYAIAGKEVFYVLEETAAGKILNQYDPVRKTFIEVPLPAQKNETFVGYKYFQAAQDKLLILTEFKGKREKDPPLYKMFLYTEQ